MGRPSKEPPSPSPLLPAIVRHAQARGHDVEALGWRFGLGPDAAARDTVNAAADAPNELLDAIAATEPEIVLHLAVDLPSRHHALVALAARTSATVRDALGLLARWVRLLHDGLEATLEIPARTGDHSGIDVEARWVVRTPRRPRGLGRHVHELALAYALARLREGAGDDLAPTRVWFAHARPPDLRPMQRFFAAADVDFGHETSGMAFAPAALERAMRLADAKTVAAVAPLVDAALPAPGRPSFAERVAAHLASSLPGDCDAADTARALHMSARTLHRRLEQEGARFGEVLDEVRLDLARRLLTDQSLTLGEIAMRLGFADLATFSRAFKRWTGQPPGQWRRS
jgi:AraC-like DNA-binding protein